MKAVNRGAHDAGVKSQGINIVLFGKDFWERLVRFEVLVKEGTISPEDLSLCRYFETAEEAWEITIKAKGNSIPNAVAVANILKDNMLKGTSKIEKITVDSEPIQMMGRTQSNIEIILKKI